MPDIGIGWSEILLVAVIAIVVVGPKDLPRLMSQAARWMRAARKLAGEFQGHVEQLAREAEYADLEKLPTVRSPREEEPKSPPPPLSALPPEGGSFNPPQDDVEDVPEPVGEAGSGTTPR